MAFLEIKNKKEFVLQFIENSIIDKTVSLDEIEELQKSEIRRKKDWDEWNVFQRNCRRKIAAGKYEELDSQFEEMNESHLIRNATNDIDIQVMKASFDRRTRYVRRLKYILFLTKDIDHVEIDGIRCSMRQIYSILTSFAKEDAEKELKDQISINRLQLELNDMNIRKDNKYYLNEKKRQRIEKELLEYEELLERLHKGGHPMKIEIPEIINICNESSINTYKAIYNVKASEEFDIVSSRKTI